MITIGGVMYPVGECGVCKMKGVLAARDYISPENLSGVRDEYESRQVYMCGTCFDTPTGMKSANLQHQRYPQAEYDKDKLPAKK